MMQQTWFIVSSAEFMRAKQRSKTKTEFGLCMPPHETPTFG
jgi:hypothetical protein